MYKYMMYMNICMVYVYKYMYMFLLYMYTYIHTVEGISLGMEQQQISKWFLLEKTCMRIHEIFIKYTWNT